MAVGDAQPPAGSLIPPDSEIRVDTDATSRRIPPKRRDRSWNDRPGRPQSGPARWSLRARSGPQPDAPRAHAGAAEDGAGPARAIQSQAHAEPSGRSKAGYSHKVLR